jgi:asparaginyl-tRNA synthetase
MKLHTVLVDYTVKKVLAVAAFCGLKVEVVLCSSSTLAEISPDATTMCLEGDDGAKIVNNAPILKAIAVAGGDKGQSLLGGGDASVDEWLSFARDQLEVPLQVLIAKEAGDKELLGIQSIADSSAVSLAANKDIDGALVQLETALTTNTFLVGQCLTLADIAVAVALHRSKDVSNFNPLTCSNPIRRWYFTTVCTQSISALFQETIPPSPSATQLGIVEKWDRCRIRVKELLALQEAAIGTTVCVKGWVRTLRSQEKGALLFVELNDGSSVKGIQIIASSGITNGVEELANCGGAGACISVTGTCVASPAKGQLVEVKAQKVVVLGAVYGGDNNTVGGKSYPMAKKAHSLEFLREKAHLRPRSKMFSSAMRMRHAMAFATHEFFNKKGFVYVHTPLITSADCEGAGEMFSVTTLLPEDGDLKAIPLTKKGKIDYSKDFFSQKCALTVSGQLNVETHCCALSDVYTFGPTFRAENSHTSRHLAEFWMIEPEIAFADIGDDMALAEDYVRYCTSYALKHCADDISYFENDYPAGEKGLKARLENVVNSDFARITYTDAVELLQKEIADKKVVFERYPNWGDDLGSEHERYITEKIYKRPTIVINYPKGIKAFYMKLNDDNETVAAMDILVPKIGELIGGSQREDDLETLMRRSKESGVEPEDISWYADLRKYGTVPHAGFGLGFERLVMFVTGLENIRDVIPFPRVPGHAEF